MMMYTFYNLELINLSIFLSLLCAMYVVRLSVLALSVLNLHITFI